MRSPINDHSKDILIPRFEDILIPWFVRNHSCHVWIDEWNILKWKFRRYFRTGLRQNTKTYSETQSKLKISHRRYFEKVDRVFSWDNWFFMNPFGNGEKDHGFLGFERKKTGPLFKLLPITTLRIWVKKSTYKFTLVLTYVPPQSSSRPHILKLYCPLYIVQYCLFDSCRLFRLLKPENAIY